MGKLVVTPRRSVAGAVVNVEPTAFQLAQRHCCALPARSLIAGLAMGLRPRRRFYDPADHLVVRKAIPSTPHTAFQEIMNAMRRASQKHLAKPRKTIRELEKVCASPFPQDIAHAGVNTC